jgi:hypothetical protein
MLFVTIYLAMVILLHRGLTPLLQFAGVLREAIPSRQASTLTAETVESRNKTPDNPQSGAAGQLTGT